MKSPPGKILIIRLSSIGDVVLTSPIIRSLQTQFPEAELHFLTKAAFAPLLDHHPALAQVHRFAGDMHATVAELKAEGFDYIIDLHRNIRSAILKIRLGVPSASYTKDRWPVLLYTKYKLGKLPDRHTVERYAHALRKLQSEPALPLELSSELEPLELFLPPEAHTMAAQIRGRYFNQPPIGVVLGGKYATKRWPNAHFITLLNQLKRPVLLLGGPEDKAAAEEIKANLTIEHFDAVGQYDLVLSAALVKECAYVITHDTGLMHIAAAFQKTLFVLWGNTVPELGFSAWKTETYNLEVPDLKCRPCTKLGYDECPKGHFKCMLELKPAQVLKAIEAWEAGKP